MSLQQAFLFPSPVSPLSLRIRSIDPSRSNTRYSRCGIVVDAYRYISFSIFSLNRIIESRPHEGDLCFSVYPLPKEISFNDIIRRSKTFEVGKRNS